MVKKMDRFPSMDSVNKPESDATKVLKLFGKDLVVHSDTSETPACLSRSPSSDMGESVDTTIKTVKNLWDCRTLYYVDGRGNQVEKPTPFPWWVLFRGVVVPPFECHVKNGVKKEESLRKGSWAGSSNESMNDLDAKSQVDAMEKRPNTGKANKGFVPYKRCFSEKTCNRHL